MQLSKPYPHYCAIHRAYYGSPTDTIPATMCPLCGIKAELVAQPAPRTYEACRALSWVDAVESSGAYMPAVNPVALLQSVDHIKKALATYHRLRANKEPAVDALKSIDNAIFNEEHVLNAISAAAPSPATAEAEGEPPFAKQSINTERMLAIADELESEGHYTMATSVRRITAQRDALASPPAVQGQKADMLEPFRKLLRQMEQEQSMLGQEGTNNCRYRMGELFIRSLQNALDASPAPVPEGWVMVPKKITKEMCAVYARQVGYSSMPGDVWDALLSVAPVAPKGET